MTSHLTPLFSWRGAVASPDSGLAPTSRHVALTLSLHMSERGDSCFPSIETVADETGLHYDTVHEHLRILATEGWLHKEHDRSIRGHGTRVLYTATVPTTGAQNTGAQNTGAQNTGVLLGDHRGAGPETTGVQDPAPREDVIEDVSEDVISGAPVAPKARKRNPIHDALAQACDMDPREMTRSQARACGVAAAELTKVEATEEEIFRRAGIYRQKFPQAALTPNALTRHWAALRAVPVPAHKPNLVERARARANGHEHIIEGTTR